MGWLVHNANCPLPYGQTPDSYLRETCEMLTAESTERGCSVKILASSFVGKVWYAAAHTIIPPDERYPNGINEIMAYIFLTCGSARGGFGYKDMTECMGPRECDCPAYILNMLTPIEDMVDPSYASEWRARCRERAAAKAKERQHKATIKPGCRVTLPSPLSFGQGAFTASEFTAVEYMRRGKRRMAFRTVDGHLCRISARQLGSATVS